MTFPCSQCGGKVRAVPGKGRMLGRTPVPDLLGVPTCSQCGTMFWNEELVDYVERANKPSPWCIMAGEKLIEAAERRCPEMLQELRAELGIEANVDWTDAEVVKWLDARCHSWGVSGGTAIGAKTGADISRPRSAHAASPAEARRLLAKEFGLGPKVDKCPLPKVGSWLWAQHYADQSLTAWVERWILRVWPKDDQGLVRFEVLMSTCVVATGLRATYAGARRAAEREARQQWVARNRKR